MKRMNYFNRGTVDKFLYEIPMIVLLDAYNYPCPGTPRNRVERVLIRKVEEGRCYAECKGNKLTFIEI